MATSEDRIDIENNRRHIVDVVRLENEFKKDKCRAKSNFTRSKNKLLSLIAHEETPSRREIHEACKRMDSCMDIVMEVLSNFSDFYVDNNELQKSQTIVGEMEKIDEEFHAAHERKREYLDSQHDDNASVSSGILSIDLLQRMNISDDQSETDRKEASLIWAPRTDIEVTRPTLMLDTCKNSVLPQTLKGEATTQRSPASSLCRLNMELQTPSKCHEIPNPEHHGSNDLPGRQCQDPEYRSSILKHCAKPSSLNMAAASFQPDRVPNNTASASLDHEMPSVGQDLWRQLKRVQIPVFSGDKRSYPNWKAAFQACIDSAPATPEYKLLQLRQYLSGEALKSIENLGHSAMAYDAAKERLERKFGGKRRQIAIYLDELERFQQIRIGNARDLEQFADLLDVAMINLQEAGQYHELGAGSLYTKLQRKLPECMLSRYHRWIYENGHTESVLTLRTWIIQESEFQTIASETVRGFAGDDRNNQSNRPEFKYRNQRTLFGDTGTYHSRTTSTCQVCDKPHRIWSCNDFIQKSVPERWNIAKLFQLCYRCLGDSHYGKLCPRSRQCGINACRQLHHKLLHQDDRRLGITEVMPSSDTAPNETDATEPNHGQRSIHVGSHNSVTEGKEQMTMVTQNTNRSIFMALRTVPVIVKNGERSLKINALLDDASTKSYVNADVAAELGLHGKTEKMTVNVLNGQIETFQTKPVNMEVMS